MSASTKKKLRNEQNAAAMTEKQQQEIKEAKKLRLYTRLFAVAIAVMLVVVVASKVLSSGMIARNATALTVGGTKVSAAELNHYYIDSINQFLDQAGDYVSLFGLDTTVPLDEQYHNEEEGITWADYFLDGAAQTAQSVYAVYNAAKAEGYQVTDETAAEIDSTIDSYISQFELYATLYGYSSVDNYIRDYYGEGCNEDTFRSYAEVQLIASEYATAKNEALVYDDAALRAEEAENYNAYSAFTYNYYYLAATKFYEGGTENEDGTVTYSDEEMAAGRSAAEAAANSLLTAATVEELDAAVAALAINAESTTAASTRIEGYQYSSVTSAIREWVTAAERKEGDITVIANEYTSTDDEGNETKSVSGYYVVRFESKDDNLTNLVNVRHILVSFEGGTYDETYGTTTYSDEEKAAAMTSAQEILDAYLAGELTEEAFGLLANEYSTDTGSNTTGGLYENVYPGQMVTNFNDWCFDSAREVGDTGLVESEYGVHVMYFSGTSETTYRDYMIESTLRTEDMTAWEDGLLEAAELVVKNTSYARTDLTLSSES